VTSEAKKGAARSGAKAEPRSAAPRAAERSGDRASERAIKRPSSLTEAAEAMAKKPARVAAESEDNDDNDDMETEAGPEPARKPVGAGVPARRGLPTGSLHTMAREPAGAEALKQRLTALMTVQQRLGELKRSANKHFYEVGSLLRKIRDQRLYEVKGYSSLDAFAERELGLGTQFCRDAVRIHELFLPEAAQSYGMARLSGALRALEDEPSGVTALDQIPGARPAIPPHKL
jgi:hypothetical protein